MPTHIQEYPRYRITDHLQGYKEYFQRSKFFALISSIGLVSELKSPLRVSTASNNTSPGPYVEDTAYA